MADWRKDRAIIGGLMLMMFGVFFVGESEAKNLEELGMVFVKGDCYQMGDTFDDDNFDEKPVHEVCLDDFYMGQYEVTVGDFKTFIDATGDKTEADREGGCLYSDFGRLQRAGRWSSPGFLQTDQHPVVCISWNDAVAYIKWKNKTTNLTFRLPTEAEWEYAARSGGKREKWAGTSERSELGEYAWLKRNSGSGTHPVGRKRANGLELYDMTGNAKEWVADWYGEKFYKNSPKNNPRLKTPVNNPEMGQCKVARGGSWDFGPRFARASRRSCWGPETNLLSNGFRLSHSLPLR